MTLATTVWVLHLTFMPPLFPNGGFVTSKLFATYKECVQAMSAVGLTNTPSYDPVCIEQNASE